MNAVSGRTDVSLVLMQGSPEAQATLDVLERDNPDLVMHPGQPVDVAL
mgnify:CR=1 FL=1